jgi:hypothetical protein
MRHNNVPAVVFVIVCLERLKSTVPLLELIEWAEAIGFDPEEAVERISKMTSK